MAKVRIQARSADTDAATEAGELSSSAQAAHHGKGHRAHDGALDILARVLKEEGFLGWYQVCMGSPSSLNLPC
jgi:adenine nucleotide transporter 17